MPHNVATQEISISNKEVEVIGKYLFDLDGDFYSECVGYLGAVVGAVASWVYYDLGVNFSKQIIPRLDGNFLFLSEASDVIFGIISLLGNSGINVLITKYLWSDLYKKFSFGGLVRFNRVITYLLTFSSLSIPALLSTIFYLDSYDINDSLTIFFSVFLFVTNFTFFYYSAKSFLTRLKGVVLFYLFENGYDRACRRLLLNRLEEVRLFLIKADEVRGGIEFENIEEFILRVKTITCLNNSVLNCRKREIIMVLSGAVLGGFSIIVFYPIAKVFLSKICLLFECDQGQEKVRSSIGLFLSIYTLSFLALIAIMLTIDSLEYVRLNLIKKPIFHVSLVASIFLLVLGSIMPNAYFSVKYLLDIEISLFLKIIFMISAIASPGLVNGTWFYELIRSLIYYKCSRINPFKICRRSYSAYSAEEADSLIKINYSKIKLIQNIEDLKKCCYGIPIQTVILMLRALCAEREFLPSPGAENVRDGWFARFSIFKLVPNLAGVRTSHEESNAESASLLMN